MKGPPRALSISAASAGRLGTVELPASATSCTVQLEPAATLSLRLRDPPPDRVLVSVPGGLPFREIAGTTLQVSGAAAAFPVPPGTHRLDVSSGPLGARPEFTARPGQRVNLVVALTALDGGQ
jgi:hypothetical protein